MKRMITLIGALAGIGLAACQTTDKQASVITTAQQTAVAVCGFLPTVETVANILAAGNPLLATGSAIADAICAAVKRPGAAPNGTPPTVAGVAVLGNRVR